MTVTKSNNKPLVSVIIPVYNSEKYLPACLDSLKAQTDTNFEIILINDGSTDASEEICLNFISSNPSLTTKYVSIQNSGTIRARIQGAHASTCPYITFIDNDDLFSPTALASINNAIESKTPDLLVFGYTQNLKDKEANRSTSLFENYKKEQCVEALCKNSYLNSIWGKAFKKELFLSACNDIPDYKIFMFEDLFQISKIIYLSKTILQTTDTLYIWRPNISSTGTKYKSTFFDGTVVAFTRLKQFASEWSIEFSNKKLPDMASGNAAQQLLSIARLALSTQTPPYGYQESDKVINSTFFQDNYSHNSLKYVARPYRFLYWAIVHRLRRLAVLYAKLLSFFVARHIQY